MFSRKCCPSVRGIENKRRKENEGREIKEEERHKVRYERRQTEKCIYKHAEKETMEEEKERRKKKKISGEDVRKGEEM
jgi:hypothetical protein